MESWQGPKNTMTRRVTCMTKLFRGGMPGNVRILHTWNYWLRLKLVSISEYINASSGFWPSHCPWLHFPYQVRVGTMTTLLPLRLLATETTLTLTRPPWWTTTTTTVTPTRTLPAARTSSAWPPPSWASGPWPCWRRWPRPPWPSGAPSSRTSPGGWLSSYSTQNSVSANQKKSKYADSATFSATKNFSAVGPGNWPLR